MQFTSLGELYYLMLYLVSSQLTMCQFQDTRFLGSIFKLFLQALAVRNHG